MNASAAGASLHVPYASKCLVLAIIEKAAARQASGDSGRGTHRSQSAARVMSATTARLRTPLAASSAAVASAVARTTSTTATAAPASPSACANARPMPWPPPGARARGGFSAGPREPRLVHVGRLCGPLAWSTADKRGTRTGAHACKPSLTPIRSGADIDTITWLACRRSGPLVATVGRPRLSPARRGCSASGAA